MKLQATKEYLLLTEAKAEIKKEEFPFIILDTYSNTIRDYILSEWGCNASDYYEKIIAYYPLIKEAKELDLPLLPDPFKQIDDFEGFRNFIKVYTDTIFELVMEITEDSPYKSGEPYERELFRRVKNDWHRASWSDKQFSLEDMMKAYTQGHNDTYDSSYVSTENPFGAETVEINQENFDKLTEKYFASLSTQQLPKEFKTTISATEPHTDKDGNLAWETRELKTIINAEGKKELVGTYKY